MSPVKVHKKVKYNNMLNMIFLKTSTNHSKSLILGSRYSFSTNFNIFEKKIPIA